MVSGAELAMLVAVALAAASVTGTAGFGAGLVFMPAALSVTSAAAALTASCVMALVTNLVVVCSGDDRPDLPEPELQHMLAGAAVGAAAGVPLFALATRQTLQVALGLLVLVSVAALTWVRRRRVTCAASRPWAAAAGAVSGALSVTVGPGSAPVMIYLLTRGLAPSVVRRTAATFFLMLVPIMLISRWWPAAPRRSWPV